MMLQELGPPASHVISFLVLSASRRVVSSVVGVAYNLSNLQFLSIRANKSMSHCEAVLHRLRSNHVFSRQTEAVAQAIHPISSSATAVGEVSAEVEAMGLENVPASAHGGALVTPPAICISLPTSQINCEAEHDALPNSPESIHYLPDTAPSPTQMNDSPQIEREGRIFYDSTADIVERPQSVQSYREKHNICRNRKERKRILGGTTKSKLSTRPWRKCCKQLKDHDHNTVKGWKEDIDTLLVFAGLFSAVLTAFIVESYKLLQPDPEGRSADLLQKILDRMENTTSVRRDPFPPTPLGFAVRVNTLWISSLVFSLAAASIGILMKQWLRDFVSSSASAPRESARIRTFRHQGLRKWRIRHIIAFLPILLQIALTLFFVGLLDLLWSLNKTVAGVLTCFVSASLMFLVVTTILPSIWPSSPHRSPQALAIYYLVQGIFRLFVKILNFFFAERIMNRPWPIYLPPTNLFKRRWRRLREWLIYVQARPVQNWRQRERYLVAEPTLEAKLEQELLVGTDQVFMDDKFLEETIRPCLAQVDTPVAENCLLEILAHRAHIQCNGKLSWKSFSVEDRGMFTLLDLVIDVLYRMDPVEEEKIVKMMDIFEGMCRVTPFGLEDENVEAIHYRTYELLGTFLTRNERVAGKALGLMNTIHHRAGSSLVSFLVVEDVISYARSCKADGDHESFFRACGLALAFARELSTEDMIDLRRQIANLLEELEEHLRKFSTDTSSQPSPTLLATLLDFRERDAKLVRAELIKLLKDNVSGAPSYGPSSGGRSAQETNARALAILRSMYRPPRRAKRVDPVDELETLGLHLPGEEARQTVAASSPGRVEYGDEHFFSRSS